MSVSGFIHRAPLAWEDSVESALSDLSISINAALVGGKGLRLIWPRNCASLRPCKHVIRATCDNQYTPSHLLTSVDTITGLWTWQYVILFSGSRCICHGHIIHAAKYVSHVPCTYKYVHPLHPLGHILPTICAQPRDLQPMLTWLVDEEHRAIILFYDVTRIDTPELDGAFQVGFPGSIMNLGRILSGNFIFERVVQQRC